MSFLTKLVTKAAEVVAIKPVVKKTLSKAASAGHTDLKTVDQLTSEIKKSEPIVKFGKESAAIIKTAAVLAGGVALAPLAAPAAAAAGTSVTGATAAGGVSGAGLLTKVIKTAAPIAKAVIPAATAEEHSPPQKVATDKPMGLSLNNIIKTGTDLYKGAQQVIAGFTPKQNPVQEIKAKAEAQAKVLGKNVVQAILPGEKDFTGLQNMGTGKTPGDDRPWYKQVPIWVWVSGGFTVLTTLLILIFRRKR